MPQIERKKVGYVKQGKRGRWWTADDLTGYAERWQACRAAIFAMDFHACIQGISGDSSLSCDYNVYSPLLDEQFERCISIPNAWESAYNRLRGE